MASLKIPTRSPKTLKFIIKACVSLALLIYLLYRVDLPAFIRLFSSIHWSVWLQGIVLYLLAQVLSAQRWRYLAHAMGFTGDFLHFLSMYFTGMFANLFLPSSIGGDAIRVLLLARRFRDARAIISVLFDRGMGLIAMLLLASLFSLSSDIELLSSLRLFLWSSVSVLVIGILFFPLLCNHLSKRRPSISEYVSPLLLLYTSKKAWFWCILISFVIQLLGFSIGLLCASAINMPLTFGHIVVSLSLVTLLSLLPISLNGLGLREGGLIYLLGMWGVSQEQALLLGLFLFGVQAICSLFGIMGWREI